MIIHVTESVENKEETERREMRGISKMSMEEINDEIDKRRDDLLLHGKRLEEAEAVVRDEQQTIASAQRRLDLLRGYKETMTNTSY